MELALFDLDHTLIATDSSAQWWHYMSKIGWLKKESALHHQHAQMMAEYDHGVLDMHDYLKLTLAPLVGKEYQQVSQTAEAFVQQHLFKQLYPMAQQLIREHQQAGRRVVIVSASEDFLVRPWQQLLAIDAAIGIEIETQQGIITGQARTPLSYREGKVAVINRWLAEQGISPGDCYAYSDSHNDIAMLEFASHPVATNPNQQLKARALVSDWPIMHF
ncbi:HAD family hydrolase [Vibrio metschnikovii]|uniref:HAD family hydrolase n=1 Tax=Vibrio metschnikovii TaxID=28172 RepID=UPI001648EFE5|nr:HAD family hydrolase [Vibrio metschnikovii]MBC3615782.1 HAD family hydrolase [Vibrio metschnikovii]MBC5812012.1 HAD family hydrolase [Vibrio metschnikovii]MBC5830256.1 HAD family hydrolase [Vibrio metschnikovii]MDA3138804.1 HAD family hydrolase [Vibrio metschnikovii]